MKLAVLSDLHCEYVPFTPSAASLAADVVVLAGDISAGTAALHWARRAFAHQRIVQVAGNHEFFHDDHDRLLDELRATALRLEVDFLECDSVCIGGVRFLGTTLWTDYRVLDAPGRHPRLSQRQALRRMQHRMADYRRIEHGGRLLRPLDTVRWHRDSRRWLEHALGQVREEACVVVTHHLPSFRSVSPQFEREASNAAFVSDVDALVQRADLWIHGHTHNCFDYRLGRARVVANPRGYLRVSTAGEGTWENPAFDPGLIVDVGV